MDKIPLSEAWTFWYFRERSKIGFQQELEALSRLIEMEKEFPYKGDKWLKESIKKKIILQLKIKSLTGVVR